MKTQLLCTFSDIENVTTDINAIEDRYTLVYNYMYILQDKENQNDLFITYNIETTSTKDGMLESTISVHRKKESNTIYTINALNEIVKYETGGKLDKTYIIDWDQYRNSLLLTSTIGIKKIPTKIFEIIELNSDN